MKIKDRNILDCIKREALSELFNGSDEYFEAVERLEHVERILNIIVDIMDACFYCCRRDRFKGARYNSLRAASLSRLITLERVYARYCDEREALRSIVED